MRLIHKSEGTVFSNGPTCEGTEYSFDDQDMNVAVVTVNGRYPETGFVKNEVCKEVGYVVSGTGSIGTMEGESRAVSTGDAVMLQPGETYYWEGESLVMVMPCSPAFYPEQHQKIA